MNVSTLTMSVACLFAFVGAGQPGVLAQTMSSACIEPEVSFLGSAIDSSGEGYQLTEESVETDIGGVVLNRRLDLSTSFSFDMELYLGDTNGDGSGMGLSFHNDSRGKTALSTSLGESMGFGLNDAISPSLNIELDTVNDLGADPSDDHWAVIYDGDVRQSDPNNVVIGSNAFSYDLEDNDVYDATLDWNASTNTLTFTFNGTQLFSTVIDIPSHVGTDYPWFVITAATDNSEDNEHKACFVSEPAYAPREIVIDTDDSGYNTLRDAITYANANSGIDDISFDIPGTGPFVITASSGMPTITDAGVTIDGTTQSGASCGDLWNGAPHTLMIEIDGPGSQYGVGTSVADTTIKGLSITDFEIGVIGYSSSSNLTVQCNYVGLNPDGTAAGNTSVGVYAQGATPQIGGLSVGEGNVISSNYYGVLTDNGVTGFKLRGNFIGTDPYGMSARANYFGVNNFSGSATWSDVTNNLISGNTTTAISIDADDNISGSSGDIQIAGNYIGTDRTGMSALANGSDGISFNGGTVTGVTIGGITSSARNIISGNGSVGMWLNGASDVDIFGNYIGVDAVGTSALGNASAGIAMSSTSNLTIGTGAEAGRNIIGGNGGRGIQVQGSFSGLTIAGNYIGTDNTGNTALSNGYNIGVDIRDAFSMDGGANGSAISITDNVFGGYSAALVEFWGGTADDVTIQGNHIGVGADGVTDIAATSSTEAGLYLGGGTMAWSNFTIGGTGAGEGNIIANSGADGIEITTSGSIIAIAGNTIYGNGDDGIELIYGSNVSILENSIYSNAGIGIDLNNDGVTANDSGDGDAGANELLNFPVLNQMSADGSTRIDYDFNLDVPANANGYRIDFYSVSAADGSGYGEGEIWLGSVDISHTGGDTNFTGTLTAGSSVSGEDLVSATATRKTGVSSYGPTSEFSLTVSAGFAELTALRTAAVYDPLSEGLYATPSNDLIFTLTVTNVGSLASDTDSVVLVDEIASDTIFYNGATTDFGGNVIGWSETDTGLTFTEASDVAYSNSGTRPTSFAQCTYTPSAGYDENVRFVCFNPKGAIQAGDPDPTFSIQYRVRIK